MFHKNHGSWAYHNPPPLNRYCRGLTFAKVSTLLVTWVFRKTFIGIHKHTCPACLFEVIKPVNPSHMYRYSTDTWMEQSGSQKWHDFLLYSMQDQRCKSLHIISIKQNEHCETTAVYCSSFPSYLICWFGRTICA